MPGTRKLGRASDHRKAMLRAMVTFLLENGKIETTVTRAKEVRAMTEKMITIAKKDDLAAKRQVLAYVTKEDVAKKLFDEIAPKYADVSSIENTIRNRVLCHSTQDFFCVLPCFGAIGHICPTS